MEARLTDLDAESYLRSLQVGPAAPEEIYPLNGAALWHVGEDHFVMIACTKHDTHNGHALLRRVLPPHWDVFFRAANPDQGYEVFHYGPVEASV